MISCYLQSFKMCFAYRWQDGIRSNWCHWRCHVSQGGQVFAQVWQVHSVWSPGYFPCICFKWGSLGTDKGISHCQCAVCLSILRACDSSFAVQKCMLQYMLCCTADLTFRLCFHTATHIYQPSISLLSEFEGWQYVAVQVCRAVCLVCCVHDLRASVNVSQHYHHGEA